MSAGSRFHARELMCIRYLGGVGLCAETDGLVLSRTSPQIEMGRVKSVHKRLLRKERSDRSYWVKATHSRVSSRENNA